MAKTVKLTKMPSNDNPHPTVSGSEGSIHINLHKEVMTGYSEGMKVFKGTYYCQVKLVEASELHLAVAKEQVKTLKEQVKTSKTENELLMLKLQVAEADSEHWKRKYNGMSDRVYDHGPVEDSSRNSSRKRSTTTSQSTPPKHESGKWFLPLRKTNTYS
jgi:hypothetical protein